jgi:two-component system response regulator HydG
LGVEKKASVLLVDDNASLCRTMSLILGRKGYAVTTAKDGPEALALFEERAFDITFLDIRMPVMNGVEIFRLMKKARADAVVVMMTAYAVEDLVQQALRDGAYGIVYKPLDIDRVTALIEEARSTARRGPALVVSDDPKTGAAIEGALDRRGFAVSTAGDHDAAVEAVREIQPEIVFIDMDPPAMNGLEAFLAIRKARPGTTAILIAGAGETADAMVRQALDSCAYACLDKPLDIEALLRLVDDATAARAASG